MIVVWVLGLALALNIGPSRRPGSSAPCSSLLVLLLSGYHGWAVGYAKKLTAGQASLTGPQRTFPAIFVLNEILGVVRP